MLNLSLPQIFIEHALFAVHHASPTLGGSGKGTVHAFGELTVQVGRKCIDILILQVGGEIYSSLGTWRRFYRAGLKCTGSRILRLEDGWTGAEFQAERATGAEDTEREMDNRKWTTSSTACFHNRNPFFWVTGSFAFRSLSENVDTFDWDKRIDSVGVLRNQLPPNPPWLDL